MMGYGKAKKSYAMAKMKSYAMKKKKSYAMGKKKFPDLNKDGKITKADILMGRGVKSMSVKNKSQKFSSKRGNLQMGRSARYYGVATDEKGKKIKGASDVVSQKYITVKNPFKEGKNLYARRVVKGRNLKGEPEKRVYTKVGEKRSKAKIKPISRKELNRSYMKTKRRIKKSPFGGKSNSIAVKSNPELWNRMKAKAKAKMGGKHSARAMQLATRMYQKAGGGYRGNKPK